MTNKPANLREPHFVKEFNEESKQLKDLGELSIGTPKEAAKEIEHDIKLLAYGLAGDEDLKSVKFEFIKDKYEENWKYCHITH